MQSWILGGVYIVHYGHLLHNHQGTVWEEEAMSRDVKTKPEATSLLALEFAGMFPVQDIKSWWFVAATSEILNVQEHVCASIPDGCANKQCAKASQHHQKVLGDTVMGDDDERQQQ